MKSKRFLVILPTPAKRHFFAFSGGMEEEKIRNRLASNPRVKNYYLQKGSFYAIVLHHRRALHALVHNTPLISPETWFRIKCWSMVTMMVVSWGAINQEKLSQMEISISHLFLGSWKMVTTSLPPHLSYASFHNSAMYRENLEQGIQLYI